MDWLAKQQQGLKVTEKEMQEGTFEKTYHRLRREFEELFGGGSWEKIPVPAGVGSRGAETQKLPFGSKVRLSAEEKHRYTTAKRILAVLLGMRKGGWGLYGRTIAKRLERVLANPKLRERLRSEAQKLARKAGL